MLSLTIASFNNQKLTDKCIASIDEQFIPSDVRYEKVLVDNGSNKPLKAPKGWKVFRFEKNNGNIGVQNRCFEVAKYQNVLFISNDVILYPGCIFQMLYVAHNYRFAQIMPTVLENGFANRGLVFKYPAFAERTSVVHNPIIIPSIIYLMPKWIWTQMGGFDEKFGSSQEDVDMSIRIYEKFKGTFPTLVAQEAVAEHAMNQTLDWSLTDKHKVFQKARMRLIDKHFRFFDRIMRKCVATVAHYLYVGWRKLWGF